MAGLLIALSLFGCSSTAKLTNSLTQFSSATSTAKAAAIAGLTVAQTADRTKLTQDAMKSTELKESMFKGILSANDMLQRELALEALANYANKLVEIAGIDKSQDIKTSFDSLGKSLDSTVDSIKSLDPDGAGKIPSGALSALAAIGGDVTNAYIAGRRDKSIRQALETNQASVKKLCDSLASELQLKGIIYKELEGDYRGGQEYIADQYKTLNNPPPPPTSETAGAKPHDLPADEIKAVDPKEKLQLITSYAEVSSQKEYSLGLLKSIASCYDDIASAYAAMVLQSKSGPSADPALKKLTAQVAIVSFYYTQIEKDKK